jgi:hypothetical protein
LMQQTFPTPFSRAVAPHLETTQGRAHQVNTAPAIGELSIDVE